MPQHYQAFATILDSQAKRGTMHNNNELHGGHHDGLR